MKVHERVAFLAGSDNRVRLLRELRDRPGRGAELARRCSLPRSTVHRCLDGLTARGWTEKAAGNYRLTTAGSLVLSAYEELTGTIETAVEHGSFLEHIGTVGESLPIEAIREATVIEATPENPYATMEHSVDVFESASFDWMRGIVPITARSFNEAGRPLVEADIDMEIVIDERVLETARETYAEAHQLGLDSDNFVQYVHPEPLSFGLAILDEDRVLVGAYDEHGNPRACLDGTDDALIEWAEDTYEEYRAAARRLGQVVGAE
jgi:predicted transcriptional regulator